MKRLLWLLTLLLVIFVVGCYSNPNYAVYANWNLNDDDFVGEYLTEISTLIGEIAVHYELESNLQTLVIENDSFEIRYTLNNYDIVFHFTNDITVGFYYSQLWHYEESYENIFDYSKYEHYLSFIDIVTNRVIFDYQGGVHIYKQIYEGKLVDGDVCCYYYQSDDMTGNIGYSIMWDNQYSEDDSRSVILFTFRGLLRNLGGSL